MLDCLVFDGDVAGLVCHAVAFALVGEGAERPRGDYVKPAQFGKRVAGDSPQRL